MLIEAAFAGRGVLFSSWHLSVFSTFSIMNFYDENILHSYIIFQGMDLPLFILLLPYWGPSGNSYIFIIINSAALNIHLFVQHIFKSLWCTIYCGAHICSCYLMPIILHMRKLKSKEITELVEGRGGSVHPGLSILRLYLYQTTSPKHLVFLFQNGGKSGELLWVYSVTDLLLPLPPGTLLTIIDV